MDKEYTRLLVGRDSLDGCFNFFIKSERVYKLYREYIVSITSRKSGKIIAPKHKMLIENNGCFRATLLEKEITIDGVEYI